MNIIVNQTDLAFLPTRTVLEKNSPLAVDVLGIPPIPCHYEINNHFVFALHGKPVTAFDRAHQLAVHGRHI